MASEEITRAHTHLTTTLSQRGHSFNLKQHKGKDRSTRQGEVLQAAKRGAINAAIDFENQLRIERSKIMLNIAQRHQDHYGDEVVYLQAAFVVPARDLANTFNLPRVNSDAAIVDVLRMLQNSAVVVVTGWQDLHGSSTMSLESLATVRDRLWSKLQFTERALQHSNFLDPISTIADQVPECPYVHVSDTVDRIILAMVVSGYDQVGTMNNEDVITGVITFEDVYKCIMDKVDTVIPVEHHAGKGAERESMNARGGVDEDELDEIGGLHAMTLDEVQSLKDTLKARKEVGRLQKMAQEWVEAAATEILILLLLLLDVSMTIYGWNKTEAELGTGVDNPLNIVTGIILFVFLFEAIVRVFGYRMSLLNGTRMLESFDCVIVLASIIVYLLTITEQGDKRNKDIVLVARVLRLLRLVKILRRIRKSMNQTKHRYQKDGFDLDLTYVTPSCIAMALPAIGAEANFRNAIDDVIRFFTTKHDKHYLIYNVCAERQYDKNLFDGRVERIETIEHSPPRIEQLVSFVEHVAPHLDADTSNVVAVHCKNGKGRTGVVVCSWLLYSTYSDTAQDAMQVFATSRLGARAKVEDALETPSQRRYVQYMESIVQNHGYRTNRLLLKHITLHSTPAMDRDGGCDPWFMIEENGQLVYDFSQNNSIENMDKNCRIWEARDLNINLAGDIRVVFFDHDTVPVSRDELMFFFFFHTGFVEQESMMFPKEAIDMAASDRKCRIFKEHFKVELTFEMIPGPKNSVSSSGKTVLGPWRRVEEPSLRVVEKAKRYRGREQDLAAAGKTFTITVENTKDGEQALGDPDEVGSLLPVNNNLCSADGAPVRHDNVQLISVAGHDIHGHKQAKKLMEQYKKGQEGGKNALSAAARALVSGNKRRFQEDGFDLDLTYVTPRLIAMGYPSKGVEGQYRNSETEVYRFFQERHAGHFRVINLVSERAYNLDMFHGAVARYPFPDHNPPAMELLLPCCAHIHAFLQDNDNHVVAVHCKAGKGRTGLILICYLLYGGLRRTALSARAFYDSQRTMDSKGLTIISQIRYAHYFEEQLRRIKLAQPCSVSETTSPAMLLHKVRLVTIPHFDRDGGCDPYVGVGVKSEYDLEEHPIFLSREKGKPVHVKPDQGKWELRFPDGVRVAGDTHLTFGTEGVGFLGKNSKMCHFWLHTCFMQQPPPQMAGQSRQLSAEECRAEGVPEGSWLIRMSKKEIDMAAQDKKHAKFDEAFAIEVVFAPMEGKFGVGPAFEDIKGSHGKKKRVLYLEKEEYERNCHEREMVGNDKLTFEKWLMGTERGCPTLSLKKALSTTYGLDAPGEEGEEGSPLQHHNSGLQHTRSRDSWGSPLQDDDSGHHARFLGHANTVAAASSPMASSSAPHALHGPPHSPRILLEVGHSTAPRTPSGDAKLSAAEAEVLRLTQELQALRTEHSALKQQQQQQQQQPPPPPSEQEGAAAAALENRGQVEQVLRTYSDHTERVAPPIQSPLLEGSLAFAQVPLPRASPPGPTSVTDILNAASTKGEHAVALPPSMQLAMASGSFPAELVCQVSLSRDIVIPRQGGDEVASQLELDFARALQLARGEVRCLSLTTSTAAALVAIRDRKAAPGERERLREAMEMQSNDPSSPLRSGAVSRSITQLHITPVPTEAHAPSEPGMA